ncbi:MAG TPA: PAS domain S-box protein, partial [Candidatus Wallbacteria bacterium]|nr:PAS domain S-box protein [Candidatus Wallbacteria bacterium]
MNNNSFQDSELVRVSLEKLQIPAFWMDRFGKIVKFNQAAPYSLDYSPEEFLRLSGWDVDESISKDAWASHFESVKKHGWLNFHSRYRNKNSVLIPVEVNIHFIESGGGEFLFACAADMRERKDILRTLSESEIKFRSLMETTSAAIFIYQGDKFKYANPAMLKLTGYSAEELYKKDLWQKADPDSYEHIKKIVAACLKGEAAPLNYEMRSFTKNKELKWLDVTAGVIEYNSKPAVIVTALDVTERKAAGELLETKVNERTAAYREIHQELENNKNFLDAVINSIVDPVLVKDENHKWVLLNNSYCEFMGHSREELIGRSDPDFFPADESNVFWQKDEMVLKTGLANENEEKFTDSKGDIHIVFTKKSLFIDNFKNKFIVGVVRDITEVKKTQEEIRENLRLVEALISSMPHPVFYKDRKKKYIGFNKAFSDFCGNDFASIVGKEIFDVFPFDIAARFNEQDVKLLEEGGTCVTECQLYNHVMKQMRDMLITKSAFHDASGA